MFWNLQQTAQKVHGDTAKALIADPYTVASERLCGVLLSALGTFHLGLSLVKDRDLQRLFAYIGLVNQSLLLTWRFLVERHLPALKDKADWKQQAVGDVLFAIGWIATLAL
ncbi:hypothetical protein EDD86DRAFT_202820 [Gorgonomyces haynaldii]|nr:hypothetical protein EDD86DRAFT_202820 [Gorgonomyces haynaldii]